MWNIILCIVGLVVVGITHWVYRWRNPKCKGVLPPGSMGLPLIGETLQYFSKSPYDGIPPFIAQRTAKYGTLFKTSLVGQPIVISTDPEVNYYVFQQEDKLFQCSYTKSAVELSGKKGLMGNGGSAHKYLRNLVLSLTGPDKLKTKLVSEVDRITREHLHRWTTQGDIEVKDASEIMLFIFIAGKILGMNEKEALTLRGHYKAFVKGFLSFPINLPGTAFHSGLQGRKNAIKMIKDVFEERRSSKEKANEQDFIDHLLQEIDKEETFITEDTAVDLIFFVIFAAHETTSSTMTLLFKYFTEHPDIVRQLKEEHENIIRNREDKDAPISWVEYKSMTFTHRVTNETVRLANIAPGIFRKVLKDVEIKGYTIPEGWTMVVCSPSVHLDENMYDNPLEFNPSRWKDEELNGASKRFMAFGGGNRMCVGADLSKMQTSIFIHYFMTSFKWNVANKGNIIRQPYLNFNDGIRIQVDEIQKRNKEISIA